MFIPSKSFQSSKNECTYRTYRSISPRFGFGRLWPAEIRDFGTLCQDRRWHCRWSTSSAQLGSWSMDSGKIYRKALPQGFLDVFILFFFVKPMLGIQFSQASTSLPKYSPPGSRSWCIPRATCHQFGKPKKDGQSIYIYISFISYIKLPYSKTLVKHVKGI